jgi:hypothetical protein
MRENPIDKDKITETPHSLEYGHHRGSAVVKPEDMGKVRGRAVSAMEHQTDIQLEQIRQQMELLASQAHKIQERKSLSTAIYKAECRFEPIINHVYHLYQDQRDTNYKLNLSLIGPQDWGKKGCPFVFIATVKLLADHTWDILEVNQDSIQDFFDH